MYPTPLTNQNQLKLYFIAGFILLVVGIRMEVIGHLAFYIPYWDDYTLASLVYKYTVGQFGWEELFKTVNEHRFVLNKLTAIALYELNQDQWDHRLHMVVNSFVWAFSGAFFIKIIWQELQPGRAWLALLVVVSLWVPPLFLENMLWGVQMHTFTCLLFVVVGLWCITAQTFTWTWWLGLFCLLWAPLTMAHGVFASVTNLIVLLLLLPQKKLRGSQYLPALVTAAILAIIAGLTLIGVGNSDAQLANLAKPEHIASIAKTLSWPASGQVWPMLVFVIPPFLLLYQLYKERHPPTRLTRFTLALYGFGVITALGVGIARGAGGWGPAIRYYDFLTVLPLASVIALAQLRSSLIPMTVWRCLSVAWLVLFLASSKWLISTMQFTLDERDSVHYQRSQAVLGYLHTGDMQYLQGKGDRVIPFPNIENFAIILDRYKTQAMLPYEMQTPPALHPRSDSESHRSADYVFLRGGSYQASTKTLGGTYFGETVIGSFNRAKGGPAATGGFKSQSFHLLRGEISIPYRGYLGYPGLSLFLVDHDSGKRYPVSVSRHSKDDFNVEVWRHARLAVPKGYYYLEAKDESRQLWFSFAAPRTIGKLTAIHQASNSKLFLIWGFGLVLILFVAVNVLGRDRKLNLT